MTTEQVPSNTLLARIETWLRDKDRGQKYACVRGYRRNEAERNCEGCLLTDAKSEIEATRDMLIDARLEIDALRAALGVNYEPHQSLHERMLDAANHKRVERTALEPAAPASKKKLAEAKDLLDAIMNFAYLHGFHECGYNPAKVLTDEIERLTSLPGKEQDSRAMAWALQAHEDLAEMLADGGGNMLHVRANRALGILFAEVERLEKILYPIGAALEPPTALGFGIPFLIGMVKERMQVGEPQEEAIAKVAEHAELRSEAIAALRSALNRRVNHD